MRRRLGDTTLRKTRDAPRPPIVLCDVGGIGTPDLATVDALARIAISVRRRGATVRLVGASVELLDLLAFCGLSMRLALEAERLAEEREEARRVEEEGDPGDSIA